MRVLAVAACLIVCACGPQGGLVEPTVAAKAAPAAMLEKVSSAELAALNEVASEACRCSRSADAGIDCWAAFSKQTRRFGKGNYFANACAPVSTAIVCFNDDSKEARFCVPTERTLLDGHGTTLCSAEEDRIVEAIYMRTMRKTGDGRRAMDAASAAARDLIKGLTVEAPESEGGCTG